MTRLVLTLAMAAFVAGCSGGDSATPTVETDQKKSIKEIAAAAKDMSKEDLIATVKKYETVLAKHLEELKGAAAKEGEAGLAKVSESGGSLIDQAKATGKELMAKGKDLLGQFEGEAKEIADRVNVYLNEMQSREMDYDFNFGG